MNVIELDGLELNEVWSKADPSQRASFTFPISAATGAERTSVAYAELPPGGSIPRHFDSANEVLIVLEGSVEVEVSGKTAAAGPGTLVEISAAASHHVANPGPTSVRLLHLFDAAADVVTFEEPLMPFDLAVLGG